jgi:ABC-2 type transport system permease protein
MLRSVFVKGLRDLRRSFVFWALGTAILPIWLGLMYPSVEKSAGVMQDYLENMPEAFTSMFVGEGGDFTSPMGFIDAELFSFMGPIVLIVFGIALAVRQIAGEEEGGTLGLLLSYPVSRGRLFVEKLAVTVVGVAGISFVTFVALVLGVRLGGADLGLGTMAAATTSLFLLTLAVAAIAFAVGAATGNRGAAMGVATVVAAGSYLLNALAPLVESLEPLQKASLFYYYGGVQPLREGLRAGNVVALLGVTLVVLVVSSVLFARRDVRG